MRWQAMGDNRRHMQRTITSAMAEFGSEKGAMGGIVGIEGAHEKLIISNDSHFKKF